MKNDRKIIYCLLGFELVLLSVLMLVAVIRVWNIAPLPEAPAFAQRDVFKDSLYLNYYTSQYEGTSSNTPSTGTAYNYYTFSLSKEGILSQKHTDG